MNINFKIVSNIFYSNCLIEAIKAKLKDWKHVKISCLSPFDNKVFCPHFSWSDGEYDYTFGAVEGTDNLFASWTLHKGYIRRRRFGFNQEYKEFCKRNSKAKKHKLEV